eukprot:5969343-Amphidinium_carterae.2
MSPLAQRTTSSGAPGRRREHASLCQVACYRLPAIRTYEPALVHRVGVVTVWTDASGRHSSDPQHRRCGVGYYTDIQERVFYPYLGSSNRFTVLNCMWFPVRLKLCKLGEHNTKGGTEISSNECKNLNALLPAQRIRWIKARLKQSDVDISRITADDLHGNGQADILANEGTAAHGPLEPEDTWFRWTDFANKVFHFWRLVGPRLRERPDEEPR